MKRTLRVAALAAIGAAAFVPSATAELPPLLDRELFFGNPEIAGAQLSPNGEYIAFLKPWQETRNIWVKRTDEPFESARLLTADPERPIPGFFWSRDSRYVLFVQDSDGDENYNVYAVDPAAEAPEGADAPTARNLTDAKEVRTLIYSLPKSDPDHIYIGLNDRDAAWHDLYEVTISTGERRLIRENTERIAAWVFDLEGKLRLAHRVSEAGESQLLRVDPEGFTQIYSCDVLESCGVDRFHKNGKQVYIQSNKGDVDLVRLLLLDPVTGEEELVEADPENRVDLAGTAFSQATEELVATTYYDDRKRVYYRDAGIEADSTLLEEKLEGEVDVTSATSDDRTWLVVAHSDRDPGQVFLFDRDSKELTLQYAVRERIPREHMAEMKPIRYASSDGLEIPAYLTLPKGVEPKGLPLVVHPHGGPWARDAWGFDNTAQFLANRGYAVLQPNFRGSTGYGKKFLDAGNKEWGDKMQDDITWGVKHLVAEGIADPKRVGIMGGSYGGYATLAGVAFTPDVYAAGVSIVGPSNLITLLDSIPPYWEAGRKMFHERMGDPTTPEGKDRLERQSPLNSADKIVTPLLVVQGANDPRVKQAESDQIVIALRDRGFPVDYLVASDEGHGFRRPVNNMAMFAEAEDFLSEHLGGRAQEGGSEEVVTRLAEITVDPATVKLADKVDAAAVGVPAVSADLSPGSASYEGGIEAGGQTMSMSLTRTIAEEGDTWVVTETAQLPMGEVRDETVLHKGSLIPARRSVHQGPVEIGLAFQDGKATGTMSMNGNERPIDLDLGGDLFADGAGAQDAIAALPLAEGFEVTFRNLDLQKQKVSLKKARVVGMESVDVPAGSFDTLKVEITSAEGDPGSILVWVVPGSRKVVKTQATLPEMGGAVMTLELAQ